MAEPRRVPRATWMEAGAVVVPAVVRLGVVFALVGVFVCMPPGPCVAQVPLVASYQDDFVLQTEDGSFQLRIRGTLQLDTRVFHGDVRGAVQDLDLRRARIDLMGRVHRRFAFRIQPELASSPYLRNAWADWEVRPDLHARWGQMKVPFSSSWLTQDNNLAFVERGGASPVHPFFDRGLTLRGEVASGRLAWDAGVYTGEGADVDAPSGDVNDGKEWVGRFFLRPFLHGGSRSLEGVAVVVEGTWAGRGVPSPRVDTRGYAAADFASAIWRWRTEQVLGADGHVTDRIGAEVGGRSRLGAELHYLRGPFSLSSELLEVRYRDVTLFHDLLVGSTRVAHVRMASWSGAVRSWSTWASWYLTGESRRLDDDGWRSARPHSIWGEGGSGSWEVLARYTRTWSDPRLFDPVSVSGYAPGSGPLGGYQGSTPGAGSVVTAPMLSGAHLAHEVTLGVNWTLNPMVRLQLDDVLVWAPPADRNGDGVDDNFLISGAFSGQSDPTRKSRASRWENAILLRFAFKL